jgi:hypothetical protein
MPQGLIRKVEEIKMRWEGHISYIVQMKLIKEHDPKYVKEK